MKDIILFGAGVQGRTAAAIYENNGISVKRFVDNNEERQGTEIMGIPVIAPSELKDCIDGCSVVISVGGTAKVEIRKQLESMGIINVTQFNKELLLEKERFLSYSYPTENEDLILYHVLRDEKKIFWIDVGSNDPDIGSVTKAFYERGHHGINIDIEKGLMEITEKQRPNDINLCVGVGSEEGESSFYRQGDWGGLSTLVESNRREEAVETEEKIKIRTLKSICDEYVSDINVSFLKIDVEGMEKEVLLGADFNRFRPIVLVIESTLPCTDTPNYDEWESIELNNKYHFVYSHGVNRYYVADEHRELDDRFEPWEKLAGQYCILHADLLYAI